MPALPDRPIGELVEEIASGGPAHAGTAAGLACALAASLVELICAVDPDGHAEIAFRARGLRERALELAARDIGAFDPVVEARKLPADHPAREEEIVSALARACTVPLAIVETSADIAHVASSLRMSHSDPLSGDSFAALDLARAAAAAAAELIEANLREHLAHPLLKELREQLTRLAAAG